MKSYLLEDETDIQSIRELIEELLNKSTIIDFEESMRLDSVRATTRIWKQRNKTIAFAFVNNYNNLCFEVHPKHHSVEIVDEIIGWGVGCIKDGSRRFEEVLL